VEILGHFAANLFMAMCQLLSQNWPRFIADMTKHILLFFFVFIVVYEYVCIICSDVLLFA